MIKTFKKASILQQFMIIAALVVITSFAFFGIVDSLPSVANGNTLEEAKAADGIAVGLSIAYAVIAGLFAGVFLSANLGTELNEPTYYYPKYKGSWIFTIAALLVVIAVIYFVNKGR